MLSFKVVENDVVCVVGSGRYVVGEVHCIIVKF